HENEEYHFAIDKKQRLNQRRYYVLCGWIKNIENSDYFYVKKGNNSFRSPYNSAPIKINYEIQLEINKMVGKLASKHNIEIPSQYYLVNIRSEECTCLDFIWNSSFRDVYKHCHAARLFRSIQEKTEIEDEAFQEIVSLYNKVGDAIFYPYKRQLAEKDPFRPLELSEHNTMTYGSPKKHGAKKRNPTPIVNTALLSETYSTSTPIIDPTLLSEAYPILEMHLEQNTTRIHNLKRHTQKNVENINSVNLPQKRKHVNDTQETLEAIFLEQGITWKPCAFTDLCISKNIHLADDPV
ncbi:14454_t:CDS:2, partial [Gigaspora rosea]